MRRRVSLRTGAPGLSVKFVEDFYGDGVTLIRVGVVHTPPGRVVDVDFYRNACHALPLLRRELL